MKNPSKCLCEGLFVSAGLLLAFFLSASLHAQDDALRAKIMASREFVIKQAAATEFRDSIRKSIIEYEKGLSTHCKTIDVEFDSAAVRIRIQVPIEMDQKGIPISGRWKESVPGAACNEKRMYNVQVDVSKKGLHFTPTYPGSAQGDPELQRDTLRNIELDLTMMPGVKRSCHAEVLDTRLVGSEAKVLDNGFLSSWNESWDVRTCDKTFTVPVKYIPDAKGTAISVAFNGIEAH